MASTRNRAGPLPQSGSFTVGRDGCNDIVVEDSSVSRCHAEIRVDDDGIVLVDLDSMNGTHVRENGRWIEISRASVRSQEPVLLGEVVITPDSLLNRLAPDRPKQPAGDQRAVKKPSRRRARSDPKPLEMRTATGRPLYERAGALPGSHEPAVHADLEPRPKPQDTGPEIQSGDDWVAKPAAAPTIVRRRRRILVAAIAALVMVSIGIGAIGWVLLQPQETAATSVLSKTAD